MAKGVRSNTEIKSLLPHFRYQPSQDYKEYLLVWCEREDCPSKAGDEHRPFLVHKRTFVRPLKYKNKPEIKFFSRPCPYCFRPSRHK